MPRGDPPDAKILRINVNTAKHWRGAALPSFAIQQLVSTVGAMVVGILAATIPAVLVAAAMKNTSGGNWADHIAEQHILNAAGEPYFVFPVLAAFAFGVLSHRYSRSLSAMWVWVLPAIILIWNVVTWKTGGFRPYWADVWNNFFGSDCGSSECVYELFVTAPFYTSLAYTLGWAAKRAVQIKHQVT
ncbi:MAG TPA: hypothetical protein VNZ03_21850 [Terriglobales bacterium]|nr:hypothetical protein [Terriglobales bacterium]